MYVAPKYCIAKGYYGQLDTFVKDKNIPNMKLGHLQTHKVYIIVTRFKGFHVTVSLYFKSKASC